MVVVVAVVVVALSFSMPSTPHISRHRIVLIVVFLTSSIRIISLLFLWPTPCWDSVISINEKRTRQLGLFGCVNRCVYG